MKPRTKNILLLIATLVTLFFIATSYYIIGNHQFIGIDTTYYLSVVDQMYKGKTLYLDIANAYPPVMFYLLLPIRYISYSYKYFYFTSVFCNFISSVILSILVYRTTKNKLFSVISAVLLLMMIYFLEGIYFGIEPYVLLFGLSSIILVYKKESSFLNLFLSGFLSGISFGTKQYGLAYLAVIMIYLFLHKKEWLVFLKNTSTLILGFIFSIVLIYITLTIQGVSLESIIKLITGGGYGNRTYNSYIEGFENLEKIHLLFILPILNLMYSIYKGYDTKTLLLCISGILFLSLQFYFQSYLHYAILFAPFLIWSIFPSYYQTLTPRKKIIYIITTITFAIYPTFKLGQFMYKNSLGIIKACPQAKQKQEIDNLFVDISEAEKNTKTFYCYPASIAYYYKRLTPPLLEKYGYSFGFETTDVIIERINNADYVVIKADEYNRLCNSEQIQQILSHEFEPITNNHRILRRINNE